VRQACVLVADDDPSIRRLLCTICMDAGYTVQSANHGARALEILRQADEPWIVLLDVTMPIMTGPEVCAELVAAGGVAASHLVLLMTAGIFPKNDPPPPARAVLTKPFDVDALLDVMAQLGHVRDARQDESTGVA
jgi:CheY-like chemotaxis protein